MCQYSAIEGVPNDWHLVHLVSRAVGGAALVMAEATGVEAAGRISPGDTGIYSDDQEAAWKRIVELVKGNGAVAGIQLAHAGRKASVNVPWAGGGPLSIENGGWRPIYSASPIPFADGWIEPEPLDREGIERVVAAFGRAAERALRAGFEVVEIHGAHGYLINQFLSPISNRRTDEYGGSFENRTRFLRRVIEEVRRAWPDGLPLFLRISASEYAEGGWTLEDSVELAKMVGPLGVDLIDCSSGGNVANARIEVGPGYQVPFAEAVKRDGAILTAAVGMITEPAQANEIIESGKADLVMLAREMLRDPYWPRRAAKELGDEIAPPKQYGRAW